MPGNHDAEAWSNREIRDQLQDSCTVARGGTASRRCSQDGAWRIPHVNKEFISPEEIRTGIERLRSLQPGDPRKA
jgi:hypothetical protein